MAEVLAVFVVGGCFLSEDLMYIAYNDPTLAETFLRHPKTMWPILIAPRSVTGEAEPSR